MMTRSLTMVDIGANMLDPMFQGIYRGKSKHESDLELVLRRASENGVKAMMITGTSREEARPALDFAKQYDDHAGIKVFSTVGVHPTRAQELNEGDAAVKELMEIARAGKELGKVVAIGECGLDYERLEFCDKETQLKNFPLHFQLSEELKLPLFLHNRASSEDLANILRENRERFTNGVVHSFDGTIEEMDLFLDLGLSIGINGCSLRTPENLLAVKHLPLDRLLIETDSPWCDIRKTHAGFEHVQTEFPKTNKPDKHNPTENPGNTVKGRNEPCHLIQVAEVIAAIKQVSVEEVANQTTMNARNIFELPGF